jgi:hypothetical protein
MNGQQALIDELEDVDSRAKGHSSQELDRCHAAYARLHQKSAKKAIEFYRLRERAARPRPN